ncbi:MAG: ribosome-associated translation inhibitor RaiA [Patescibacteria group bacterium]|nr:ribosome-associated translation inhibitor RaiA [Patescibacteria group bacterium]
MKLNIKASGLDLTPAINEYVENKIKSAGKIITGFEKSQEAEINFEITRTTRHHRHGNVYHAKANVYLNGKLIRVEHDGDDVRAIIDKVKDKLKIEFQKFKEVNIEDDRHTRGDKI